MTDIPRGASPAHEALDEIHNLPPGPGGLITLLGDPVCFQLSLSRIGRSRRLPSPESEGGAGYKGGTPEILRLAYARRDDVVIILAGIGNAADILAALISGFERL